jgi:hypothetical protein
MTLVRRVRSYFFGPQGNAYTKFSKSNFPTEQRYKELFDSAGFIVESNDTAKESEQGFVELQTDTESRTRSNPSGSYAKSVRAHQLPELITTNAGTDTDDAGLHIADPGYAPTELLGRGIKVTWLMRTISGYFRRIWKIENTMTVTAADATVTVAEPTSGNYTIKANVTTGPVGPVGPSGTNAVIINYNKEAIIPCNSSGVALSYPIILVSLYNGSTQVDMSGYNLLDVAVFNPIVTNCTATYAHSGTDIQVTLTGATADTGSILIQIKYSGNWITKTITMMKVKAGTDANAFVYKGETVTPPVAPSFYWWYRNPNTLINYFYDIDSVWKILLNGRQESPTQYHTLTNAGLIINIINTDKQEHIIHIPAGIVLAGPITFTTSGTFPDGFKINVIFDSGFDSAGQAVTIFGNVIPVAQCLVGGIKVSVIYSLTDTSFKSILSYNYATSDLVDSGWIEMTNAECLTSFSAPKTFIPAPGVGKYIKIRFYEAYNKFGTVAFGAAGVDVYYLYYDTGVSSLANFLHTFLETIVDQITEPTYSVGSTPLENKAIMGKTTTTDLVTGDGSIFFRFIYSIVSIP